MIELSVCLFDYLTEHCIFPFIKLYNFYCVMLIYAISLLVFHWSSSSLGLLDICLLTSSSYSSGYATVQGFSLAFSFAQKFTTVPRIRIAFGLYYITFSVKVIAYVRHVLGLTFPCYYY